MSLITEESWTRSWAVFIANWGKYYKVEQLYYKVGQLLQSEATLLQRGTIITGEITKNHQYYAVLTMREAEYVAFLTCFFRYCKGHVHIIPYSFQYRFEMHTG